MAKHDTPFFLSRNSGFKVAKPEDDYLHPKANAEISGDSLTETQYFGLCMPKERIHGLFYLWHHPNLKVVSGGVWVWQGMRPEALSCEIFDFNYFLSDSVLKNDLEGYTLPNGYGVRMIEPLKKHRLTYTDEKRGNEVDLTYTALAPPVLFGDGRHFEQGLKVQGKLTMRGKTYEVNSYNVRDRSWGKLRNEAHVDIPPLIWMTGVFNDHFFFNCNAIDHPDLNPDWKHAFPDFSGDQTLLAGWIHKDGEVSEVVSCRKRTTRDPVTLIPQRIEMELTDAKQRVYRIKGEILAASCMATWPNERSVICQTRWECDGQIAHGDSQEVHFYDFMRAMYRRS